MTPPIRFLKIHTILPSVKINPQRPLGLLASGGVDSVHLSLSQETAKTAALAGNVVKQYREMFGHCGDFYHKICPQLDYMKTLLENDINDSVVRDSVNSMLSHVDTKDFFRFGVTKTAFTDQENVIKSIDKVVSLAHVVLSSENKVYPLTNDSYRYLSLLASKKTLKAKLPQRAKDLSVLQMLTKLMLKNLASSKPLNYIDEYGSMVLKNDLELDPLKHYLREYGKETPELSDHLYQKYYLSRLSTDNRAVCEKLHKDFGVKLFVSNEQDSQVAKSLYDEFSEWNDKGNGEIKNSGLNLIDFGNTKTWYLENPIAGAFFPDKKLLSIANESPSSLKWALRHELTHLMDKIKVPDNLDVVCGIDFAKIREKRLYEKELFFAGIPTQLREYAYKNKAEFIAVAAQGDCSRYSKKFGKLLVALGLPDYVLKMKPSNQDFVDKAVWRADLKKAYPEINSVKEFEELCEPWSKVSK